MLVDAYGLTAAQRQTFLTEVAYGQAMNKLWWEGQRVAVFGAAMQRFTSSWVPLSDALSDG